MVQAKQGKCFKAYGNNVVSLSAFRQERKASVPAPATSGCKTETQHTHHPSIQAFYDDAVKLWGKTDN